MRHTAHGTAVMFTALVCLLALAPSCMSSPTTSPSPPQLPLQFEADLEITAHLLDPTVAYPPSLRRMKIRYDYNQGLARADILAGFDKGKSYIRRYDTKREYKVKYGKYANCERAYLGTTHCNVTQLETARSKSCETMPRPELPSGLQYKVRHRITLSSSITGEHVKGIESVLGHECERWTYNIPHTMLRINVFNSVVNHVPIRLTQESETDAGDWAPIVTYDLLNLKLKPQDLRAFDDIPGGYTHETCTRSVVGFPYIHIFDHYAKF